MVVLEKLLNNQVTGRLKTKLLDSKICTGAQAIFEMKCDPGLFVFALNPTPGFTLAKVLSSLDGLVTQLSLQSIMPAELNRAKKQAEFEFYNEIDGPFHACFHLGYFETLVKLQEAYISPEKLRLVSEGDILRVAKRYLISDARVVGQLCSISPVPASKPSARTRVLPPGKIIMQRTPSAQGLPSQMNRDFPYIQRAGYQSEDSSIEPLVQADTSLSTQSSEGKASARGSGAVDEQHVGNSDKQPGNSGISPAPLTEDVEKTGLTSSDGKAPDRTNDSSSRGVSELRSSNVYFHCFDNGLNVIVVQSHLSPLVQIVGSTNAGQIYESPDKKGVSQLLATAMNFGSSKETRQQALAEQNDNGLSPKTMLEFEAGIEQIGFKTRCLSKDLPTQLRLVASALREPRYQDVDIEKRRESY